MNIENQGKNIPSSLKKLKPPIFQNRPKTVKKKKKNIIMKDTSKNIQSNQ